jgi:hypothetical protein
MSERPLDDVEERWFQCVIRESVLKGNRYPWNLDDFSLVLNSPTTPPAKGSSQRAENTPECQVSDLPKPFEPILKNSARQEESRIKPYTQDPEIQKEKLFKKFSNFSMIDER